MKPTCISNCSTKSASTAAPLIQDIGEGLEDRTYSDIVRAIKYNTSSKTRAVQIYDRGPTRVIYINVKNPQITKTIEFTTY